MTDPALAYSTFSHTCWDCGRTVTHGPRGDRFHWCRLRLLSRARWRGYLDGWHYGYRWVIDNPDDPMVLADADDYGTGWAGHMRVGHISVATGTPPEPTP